MPALIEKTGSRQIFTSGEIIDIGGSRVASHIGSLLYNSFVTAKRQGKRPTQPEELLYDDEGLKIWAEVIYHPEYYQTKDEIDLLVHNGTEIASYIQPGTTMVDLGAGDTRKVAHFLSIVDELAIPATYLALDISRASLDRGIVPIAKRYNHISCVGLWGSFTDMHGWLSRLDDSPRLFLSLGSVLFNDVRDKAKKQLRTWAIQLREQDYILAGMDGHRVPQDADKIWASYHGRGGGDAWTRFWSNGFKRANEIAGADVFHLEDWDILGRIEQEPVSHVFTFTAKKDIAMHCFGIKFAKGDQFDWFDAHKNGEHEVRQLCDEVGLVVVKVWKKPGTRMSEYLIKRKSCRT